MIRSSAIVLAARTDLMNPLRVVILVQAQDRVRILKRAIKLQSRLDASHFNFKELYRI